MSDRIRDRRDRGWYWADNAIIDVYGPELGVYAVAVYHVLARYADEKGKAFPGVPLIAQKLKCSERKVRYAIKQLREAKLITKTAYFDDETGRQSSNRYTLHTVQGEGAGSAGGAPARGAGKEDSVIEETTESPDGDSVPAPNGVKPPTPHQAMMAALAEVCTFSIASMAGKYARASKVLRDSGRTPADVARFGEIYQRRAREEGWSFVPTHPDPLTVAKYIIWIDEAEPDVEPLAELGNDLNIKE